MTTAIDTGRRLTGWGVLAWIIGFFAVIFAANGAFIYLALSTFPGVEVDSSYKAGQQYEAEEQAGRAQAERAWTVDAHVALAADGARVTAAFADKAGVKLGGLRVVATLAHTVDTSHDRTAVLTDAGAGVYRADLPDIGPGRWTLVLTAERDGERLFLSRNIVDLAP